MARFPINTLQILQSCQIIIIEYILLNYQTKTCTYSETQTRLAQDSVENSSSTLLMLFDFRSSFRYRFSVSLSPFSSFTTTPFVIY